MSFVKLHPSIVAVPVHVACHSYHVSFWIAQAPQVGHVVAPIVETAFAPVMINCRVAQVFGSVVAGVGASVTIADGVGFGVGAIVGAMQSNCAP